MSGFAFSPHFSQRWLATSNTAKRMIIQELADIHDLLLQETSVDDFSFSVKNLNDELDFIIAEEAKAEQYAKEQEAKRQESLRLAQEQAEKERAEKERLVIYERVKKSTLEQLNVQLEAQLQKQMEQVRNQMQAWIEVEVEKQLQQKLPKIS